MNDEKGFPKEKSKIRIRCKCLRKSVRFWICKKLSDSDNILIRTLTHPCGCLEPASIFACAATYVMVVRQRDWTCSSGACCMLGTSYLQQFCTSVVNAIVSPFVLLDIAMESASFLAANSINQVTQQVRGPLLNSLLQKCLQM